MASTAEVLRDWVQKHGAIQGEPFATNATIEQTNSRGDKIQVPNPDPVYRYTFADGSLLEITGDSGQIQKADEKPPKTPAADRPNYRSQMFGGELWESWDGHPWARAAGTPTVSSTSTARPVTATNNLDIVTDPVTKRPIAYRDPSTGTTINLDPSAKPDKAQIVPGQRGAIYSWDGTKLTTLREPEAADYKPKENETRPNVDKNGYKIQEVYRGGQWVTDTSVAPTPWSPELAGKPTEGATRPNVVQGQQVQQIYKGGEWVIDPSVQPQPYGQQQNTAAEVQRLQGLAQQERDRINALPIDDAEKQRQWEQWWNVNVEPRKQELARQQQQTDFENQIKYGQEQRTAETTRQTGEINRFNVGRQAGQDAVDAALKTLPYKVGPNFGANFAAGVNTLSRGGGEVNFSPQDFTFDMPNLDEIASLATSRALAHISPYAASQVGGTPLQIPQSYDVAGALSQSRYAPTTTIKPDGTVVVEHAPPQPDPLTTNQGGPLRGLLSG